MGRRRDDLPEIELLDEPDVGPPPPPPIPPVAPTPPTMGPRRPTGAPGPGGPGLPATPPLGRDPSSAWTAPGPGGGPFRQEPPGRTPPGGGVGGDDRGTDWWRWGLGLGLVVLAVLIVLAFDRRSQLDRAGDVAPATLGTTQSSAEAGLSVTEGEVAVPDGLTGTLYALAEDETLVEIDLASGRSRVADLGFEVAPWFVNQVVALPDVVLVTSRRQVFVIDRATLSQQQRLAEGRWVVAPPSGAWAALVPFGAAFGGDITVLDGQGSPLPDGPLRLPSGASVQGAVEDGLVVDAAGTLRVVHLDGTEGPVLGTGRHLGSGGQAVARVTCEALACTTRAGTVAQPDAVTLGSVEVAGEWLFGPAAVFDHAGGHLALVAPLDGADGVVRIYDTSGATAAGAEPIDGPAAVEPPGVLPALAFSADGSVLVHTRDNHLLLWRYGSAGAKGDAVEDLMFKGRFLSVNVTPQPPPPPPETSGPPPSYA